MLSLGYLSTKHFIAKAFRMDEGASKKMSREERLAAKLRENLRRRKAQARATVQSEDESAALPKEDGIG